MAKQAITITKNFDLNKITLDLTRQLEIAGKVIRKEHVQRLERGQGVKGPLAKLKSSTIAKKTKGDYPTNASKPLVNTGKMRNLVYKVDKQKQEVNIYPGRDKFYKGTRVTMSDVGAFHQEGAGNLPKREWFGYTAKSEKDIVKRIELEIERQIKRA